MGRRCLIATLLLAGTAAPAHAGEVSAAKTCVYYDRSGCWYFPQARLAAAAGEVNDLVVGWRDDVFTFRDGAQLASGPGCSAAPDGTASCRAFNALGELGDGDDRARTATPIYHGMLVGGGLALDGGAGNDDLAGGGNLSGGPGDDLLRGGPGADAVTGGPGDDRLAPGGGAPVLAGGAGDAADDRAADVLEGGAGRDTVDYRGHDGAVRVDLADRTGPRGDRLTGFEDAFGGDGDDVIAGDGGRNRLWGGPGDDTFVGRRGRDRYFGEDGDDRVLAAGPRETVDCGRGNDAVASPRGALLLRSCETAAGFAAYPRSWPNGRLLFTLPGTRRVELRLRGRARPFAAAPVSGGEARLRVPRSIRRLRRYLLAVEVRVDGVRWAINLPR